MRKPKAIFFDLDDTLIAFSKNKVTDRAWQKCCADFLEAHPLSLSPAQLFAEVKITESWYWGDPVRHKTGRENMLAARRDIVGLTFERLSLGGDDLALALADAYSAYHYTQIHLFPNTLSSLAILKDQGFRLGLITNGPSVGQREKLSRFGLSPFFEAILIDTEVGCSKPDREIFQEGLDRLALVPEEAWMVGDNPVWDIEMPRQMGMHTVWYDTEKAGLPENAKIQPHFVIQDMMELVGMLSD